MLLWGLKILVLGLSVWLLYAEVINNPDFRDNARRVISGELDVSFPYFLAALLLVCINWGLETAKWKVLIRDLEQQSWSRAFKAVLSGVFVSFFTPNRAGEFVGRVIYVHQKKIEASVLTLAGSLAQNICTLLFGGLAALIFFTENTLDSLVALGFFIPFSVATLFFYFNLDRLVVILRYLGLKRRWLKYFLPVRHLETSRLLSVLCLSALRYLVFSLQFILVFRAFNLPVGFGEAITGVGVMFLVQSILPSIALLEFTSRGLAIHYAFDIAPSYELLLLLSSYTVWLINVFLPGFIGAVLFQFNRKSDVDL